MSCFKIENKQIPSSNMSLRSPDMIIAFLETVNSLLSCEVKIIVASCTSAIVLVVVWIEHYQLNSLVEQKGRAGLICILISGNGWLGLLNEHDKFAVHLRLEIVVFAVIFYPMVLGLSTMWPISSFSSPAGTKSPNSTSRPQTASNLMNSRYTSNKLTP